mmetsp:Transcript_99993/g.158275  ORF Transcript_99993/g.158275 Transcript_99993/m.158275 type:complete len:224 (-) Transcript_99993:43-714(-)
MPSQNADTSSKQQLRELCELDAELTDLVRLGRKHLGSHSSAAVLSQADLCSFAARLHHGQPAGVHPGKWKAHPDKVQDYPSSALQARRAPAPILTVSENDGGAIEVVIRIIPPADAIIFTTNQSVPGLGNTATTMVKLSKPFVLSLGRGLGEVHHVFVKAIGAGLRESDLVTVSAPKSQASKSSASLGEAADRHGSGASASTEHVQKKPKLTDKVRNFLEGMS